MKTVIDIEKWLERNKNIDPNGDYPFPCTIVYIVTNNLNGKQYIGCTNQGLRKRWEQHGRDYLSSGSIKLSIAIRDFGIENFSVRPLLIANNLSHAVESACIDYFNTLHPNGYNVRKG